MRPTHSVSRNGDFKQTKKLNVAKDVPTICVNLIITEITISEKKWEAILSY
jgi:hypothetical protein